MLCPVFRSLSNHKYSGRGYLLRVGHNPSGRFVFTPGRHKQGETLLFENLPLNAPMVYINFALIDLTDRRLPLDARHPRLLARVTHAPTPSVFVLLPVPIENTWTPASRFVVPSTTMNVPERRAYNERILDKTDRCRNPQAVRLSHNEMIDAYARSPDQVVPELCRIFEQLYGVEKLFIGDAETSIGTEIGLDIFIVDKKRVLQESMDVLEGRTFLSNLGEDADPDE